MQYDGRCRHRECSKTSESCRLSGHRAGCHWPGGSSSGRVAALEEAHVTLVSRTLDRVESACTTIRTKVADAQVTAACASQPNEFEALCQNATLIVAAGAAGACFLESGALQKIQGLKLAIDLNAVPPVGIADISVMDKAVEKFGVICYAHWGWED